MHGKNNGHVRDRVAVPADIQRERQLQAAQTAALIQARGAFRATIATAASRIVAGMLQGRDVSYMNEEQREALARESVDLARRITIQAHLCEFPTADELGQGQAEEQAPTQEG